MEKEMPVLIQPMVTADLEQVYEIEKNSFSMPWSWQIWSEEMAKSQMKHYLVARIREQAGIVAGYAGFWLIVDEAYLTNMAVRPEYRRQKIGERLLNRLLELAVENGGRLATLEVRASNTPAQNLYRKFGFEMVAIRKGYYSDNREDAWIYWKNPL